MVAWSARGLRRGRLRAKAVPVFGPFDVDGEWVWLDSGPWSCTVRRVRRFVLVLPSPLVLRSGSTGYRSRRFGRCARLGMALLPVVPTYIRGSGEIEAIQYVGYSKA